MSTAASASVRDFGALGPLGLAPYIQHTKIAVGLTRAEIVAHAQETAEYGFNAAMVPGCWVAIVAAELAGTGIVVASALDFPVVGLMTSAGKSYEAARLVEYGADQIDIGVQIGYLKSGMYSEFREDIAAVVRAAGVPIKVMLELPLLNPQEREAAVDLSLEAGAAYLKNASSGQIETASSENVRFLFERAPEGVGVKASGSIKDYRHAIDLLNAGASLLGTSAGLAIISDSSNDKTVSY